MVDFRNVPDQILLQFLNCVILNIIAIPAYLVQFHPEHFSYSPVFGVASDVVKYLGL